MLCVMLGTSRKRVFGLAIPGAHVGGVTLTFPFVRNECKVRFFVRRMFIECDRFGGSQPKPGGCQVVDVKRS